MTITDRAATQPQPATARVAAPEAPRRDIQGLRALAVGLVVVAHLWPKRLPGGFIGVDVFFVISGFLITSHLLGKPPRTPRDLAAFWGRRVRRLLPAASLVLLVSLVASVVFLPATTLPKIAHETAAASVYAENWALASSSTDYFAADDLHTPVQHYWSLSVEEQFYIVWPVLIAAALWVASRSRRRRIPAVEIALCGVFVASLAYSVLYTAANPARAYFVTPTRMWELALGGLVAVVVVRGRRIVPRAARSVAAWAGLAAVLAAALTFDEKTPFPGLWALLPTAGAALVIAAAADDAAGSPDRLWSLRPVQLTGDISYSIYLWHWPLIIIVPFVIDRTLLWPVKLAIVVAAFFLAWATKLFVEDPVRRSRRISRPLWRTFAVGAALMAITAGSATAVDHHEENVTQQASHEVADALDDGGCVGAAAARSPKCDFVGTELVTPPEFAKTDKADAYTDGCWNSPPFTSRHVCTYGPDDAKKKIALVGNSHAGYWQPALQQLAEKNDWQITTYLASMCYTVDAVQVMDTASSSQNCRDLADWQIQSAATGGYDAIVVADRTFNQLDGVAPAQRDGVAQKLYSSTLKTWTDRDIPVLVMKDIPYHKTPVPDCVAQHEDDVTACSEPAATSVPVDPLAKAAAKDTSGLVDVLDVTDSLCRDGRCQGVVGGVIAYFDQGHMSATFSQTLSPEVDAALKPLLNR